MPAFIKAISFYLPNKLLKNEDLSNQFPEWSVQKISAKTGIYQRHIAEIDEFTSDMAVNAAEKLFSEHFIDRNEIDFVILCTQSPDFLLPTTACIIQNRLGLRKNIGAFDINLGCSGYVYGLSIAKGLISSGIANNVLFLTSETYSKYINPIDKSNRTIFGDGSSATLISTNGWGEIKNFSFGTDGSGAEFLIVKNSGSRFRTNSGCDIFGSEGFERNDNDLYMNGKAIFNFTASVIPGLIKDVLNKNQLQLENIDLFIFHQANSYILNYVRKKIGIPEEKFFIDINDIGNTVSSTLPIAISRADSRKLLNDKYLLLAGFGVGLSWGSVIIEKIN